MTGSVIKIVEKSIYKCLFCGTIFMEVSHETDNIYRHRIQRQTAYNKARGIPENDGLPHTLG
jgi:DNA-directed RNA polymerase subunit RPC12/RpoP